MEDRDIIKALEGSISNAKSIDFKVWTVEVCKLEKALDLINRQKAEIERYEKEHKENFDKWLILDERTKKRYAELYEEAKAVVRAEAVKECIEKIKTRSSSCVASKDGIVIAGSRTYTISEVELYKIVKEMVGAESG